MFTIQKKLSKVDTWSSGNLKRWIILHHTGSSPQTTFDQIITFFNRKDNISVHYVVGKEGQITQLVDENDRAFHAGWSKWGLDTALNNSSIGIEVLSDGHNFTSIQIEATIWLIKDIMARNGIPAENVLRHADVAWPRGRKTDIGHNFYKKWVTWSSFQASLVDQVVKYEREWQEQSKVINTELDLFNEKTRQLAEAKHVEFKPYQLIQ